MPLQILYTVQILTGIVQCQCRYCKLYRYCHELYNAISDIVYCTGIARNYTMPVQILYSVQVSPGIVHTIVVVVNQSSSRPPSRSWHLSLAFYLQLLVAVQTSYSCLHPHPSGSCSSHHLPGLYCHSLYLQWGRLEVGSKKRRQSVSFVLPQQ